MWVFAFGSLLYEPSRGAVGDPVRAVVPGWRRTFDKRSVARGCREADALFPRHVVPGFLGGAGRLSLAAGLVRDADAAVVGALVRYDEASLDELDGREGYVPGAGADNGYLRREVTTLAEGRRVRAWTYTSNVGGALDASSLAIKEAAAVLLGATSAGSRATGLAYVARVEEVLQRWGDVDEGVQALLSAAESLEPGWRERWRGAVGG